MGEKKRIRILHVAQAAGGVDRYIQILLKYLNKEKYENIIVCSQDFKKKEYENLVVAFEQINMQREIKFSDLKSAKVVRKLIKKYKPDIVYAHSSKAGAVVRMADIGLKNVCIYNPHGWAFNMRCSERQRKLYTLIERLEASFCDVIICISDAEKKSALDKKICPGKKIRVIISGIDIEQYEMRKKNQLTRKELQIPDDAYVIGMVGRISLQKAPDVFMKAAKKIKESIPKAYFIIVGDGEQKDKIIEYAVENNLSNCLLITGWVDDSMKYVELFDIAMLLSRWEGFGLALPEYMLAQKPIIATQADAIPYIIRNNINGFLVGIDDVEGVYNAAMKLYADVELCNRFINEGLVDVYERFNAIRVSKEHEVIFESLI
ncbi:MAG: glycosyltransferase family 4 protein [Lachnospiraceae bacterium]|nr:glycosyltransferase family 4 protein [Lachnospiraceae bacterium]